MPSRTRAAFFLALLVLLAPLAAVRAAPWHATLLSSEPAAKSTLARAPTRIRLVFSEEIEPSLGRIRLVGPDGHTVTLKSAGDPHDVAALVAPVTTPLGPGRYRVEWRVVSEDGHPIDGAFGFTIAAATDSTQPPVSSMPNGLTPSPTTAPAQPGTPASTPSARTDTAQRAAADTSNAPRSAMSEVAAVPAALRGLAIGVLSALAGLLYFLTTRRAPAAQPRAARVAGRLAVATAILVPLHLVAWALAVAPDHSLGGDAIGALLASGPARVDLARTVLALLAGWALLLARRERLALVFAVLAILVGSATGHSAAIHPAWGIPSRALHLLAVAAWLGGLLWLVTLDRGDAPSAIAEAQRVSSIALTGVIVVALSGVVQTWLFLPSWGDLVHSAYGAIVLAKVAGLGVLVLFGAHHKYRVLPRLTDAGVAHGFTVSLRREIVIMSLVILLGGLLAYVSPPTH